MDAASSEVGGLWTRRCLWLRTASWWLFAALFYADSNYVGVYSAVSVFAVLAAVDRLWMLRCSRRMHRCSNLSVIPLDHQFKVLFVQKAPPIEPGDAFYISCSARSASWRSAGFFSKNGGASMGCILRVHRKTTFQWPLERVRWNFTFLEQILDAEIRPVFRGPFGRRCYRRLVGGGGRSGSGSGHCIQYLVAVDEGIWYQLEYLNYVQRSGCRKMPAPTHIIFATSSKALFGFVATNLQFVFVEIEGLTVECKLLPSNLNLVPNAKEMVQYYKSERVKADRKRRKMQRDCGEHHDDHSDHDDDGVGGDITESAILEEMEYDILSYLSIPQILFHHNLKTLYEEHPDSKLPHRLRLKYEGDGEAMNGRNSPNYDEARAEWLDNVEIEMYFAGIPFVGNALRNVCSICRIPFYSDSTF